MKSGCDEVRGVVDEVFRGHGGWSGRLGESKWPKTQKNKKPPNFGSQRYGLDGAASMGIFEWEPAY